MWTAFGLVLGALLGAVWVYCLVDAWRRADLTRTAKIAWTLIVVLLPFLGTVLYLIVGFAMRDALHE
jgi:hypothetical protein